MNMFPIVFAFIFWGGLILLIYLNFVKQSKDSPKGTNKQKFATFMKSFIPVGIATIFFVVFTAFYAGGSSDDLGTFVTIVAWGVVIVYGIFLYNKIYLNSENNIKSNNSTSSQKVVSSSKKTEKVAKQETKHWFFENFKDPTTLKVNASHEKKQQETKKEIKKDEPKKILTWDEPIKPEPKKEEPVKEEIKSSEITITSQEEEIIYAEVAKELKENRNEGVWLKAFTENDGDETKTKIAYTKKRVTDLMEELKKNKKQ